MESEGYVNLDTGKFEKRKLEGAYGGQLVKIWLLELVLLAINRMKVGYNRTTGNKQGEVDISVRLQLLWEKDDTSVLLSSFSEQITTSLFPTYRYK